MINDGVVRQNIVNTQAVQDGVFSPEHVVVMSEALSYALERISNSPVGSGYAGYAARDVRRMIASAIIREARTQPLVAKGLAEAALQAAARPFASGHHGLSGIAPAGIRRDAKTMRPTSSVTSTLQSPADL